MAKNLATLDPQRLFQCVFDGNTSPAKTPKGIDGNGGKEFWNQAFVNGSDDWMRIAEAAIPILRISRVMY